MKGFEKYTEEVATFQRSFLYMRYFADFVQFLFQNGVGGRRFTSGEVAEAIGLDDPKGIKIRKMTQNARRMGIPIGTDGKGYHYAQTKEELEVTIHHLRGRAKSLIDTLDVLEGNVDRMIYRKDPVKYIDENDPQTKLDL